MRNRLRWWIARQFNRSDRMCWADLVSWVLDGRGKRRFYSRWPWRQVRGWMCTKDAVENGRCYCGKLGADGAITRARAEGGGR